MLVSSKPRKTVNLNQNVQYKVVIHISDFAKIFFRQFSEICSRLQTARPAVIKCLLYYLVPWLFNMELVDANLGVVVSETAVASDAEKHSWGVDKAGAAPATAAASEKGNTGGGREGWGTAEATEMIMNNLFYITVKATFSLEDVYTFCYQVESFHCSLEMSCPTKWSTCGALCANAGPKTCASSSVTFS